MCLKSRCNLDSLSCPFCLGTVSAEHRSGRLGEKELGRELWSQETQSYVRSVEVLTQEGTKYSQWLRPTKGQRGRQRGKNLSPARLGTPWGHRAKHFSCYFFIMTQGFLWG